MSELITQTLDHPLFILGIVIGIMLCIVIAAAYMIAMITAPPEEADFVKRPRARRAHIKERRKREKRATTNAINMVADGCLEPPRR